LFDIHTRKEIWSGDVIEFHTKDSEKHPLPSRDLLDLQWDLHRVLHYTSKWSHRRDR
ncbi:hypothetical protein ASPCADRAFT_60809, partial [Aspergillus carbonarius ITEM 5010]